MADNLNISSDMIDNLVKMLKNSNIDDSSQNNSNNNDNNSYNSTTSNHSDNCSNSSSSINNIDFDTIMKIKSIMENINNSNNQDSRLLYSLKPYLRKSRQKKLDQYINILKISQVSKLLNQKGDDN